MSTCLYNTVVLKIALVERKRYFIAIVLSFESSFSYLARFCIRKKQHILHRNCCYVLYSPYQFCCFSTLTLFYIVSTVFIEIFIKLIVPYMSSFLNASWISTLLFFFIHICETIWCSSSLSLLWCPANILSQITVDIVFLGLCRTIWTLYLWFVYNCSSLDF